MREPNHGGYAPPAPFGLYENGLIPHEILRLLVGTVNLFDKDNERLVKVTENELRNGRILKPEPNRVLNKIFEGGVTEDDYVRVLREIGARNRRYFEKLRGELIHCLAAKKEGFHLESFLHLYRCVELISTLMPMLYARSQDNFQDTKSFFMDLMKDEKEGELKVLERFISHISRSTQINDVVFVFDLSNLPTRYLEVTKDQIARKVLSALKDDQYEIDDTSETVTVKFLAMSKYIVSLRNRIFHYSASRSNIDISEIGGASHVARISTKEGIYWFSIIYAQILVKLISTKI